MKKKVDWKMVPGPGPVAPKGIATLLIPITCTRCGKNKRTPDGVMLYASMEWRRGKRMVCPDCYETEKLMEGLETLVHWDEKDDEVPF